MRWAGADLGGDMVIARRAAADQIGDPLYNLVVVVDDAAMAISHVIRGEDHIANTAKQLLLYEALNLAIPKFAHTPLILNQEGKKLSKRDGVTSVADFQAMGYTAAALANYMTLLGWSAPEGMGERFTLKDAAAVFDFDRVNKAGARFDWDKLNWLNGQVLHELGTEQLEQQLQPLWQAANFAIEQKSLAWRLKLCNLLGPSLTLLADGVEQAKPFFVQPELTPEALSQLQIPNAISGLQALLALIPDHPIDGSSAQQLINQTCEAAGIKKGLLMKSLRAALLGRLQGPDLIETWLLLNSSGDDRLRLQRCWL